MTCPTCGHTPSNKRDMVQLDIPVAMLLSMVHALAIGRNTEMMSSAQPAADEMELMRKKLFDQLGRSHTHFRERDWTAIMLGAWKGTPVRALVSEAPNSWRKFRAEVRLGDRILYSQSPVDEPDAQTIVESLMADIDRVTPMEG